MSMTDSLLSNHMPLRAEKCVTYDSVQYISITELRVQSHCSSEADVMRLKSWTITAPSYLNFEIPLR